MSAVIRPARRAELDMMIDWAAEEGWNPGLADAAAFWAADPEGYLIAELGGAPIGCISAVRHGADFGFIGFYIMRAPWRGQGHGMALWRAGMARLAGRSVGLDGVVAQQANYARSGFALAWNNARYAAENPIPPAADTSAVVPAARLPFEALAALEASAFPAPREAFLRAWIEARGAVSLALADGRGFGVIRRARAGARIGPLVATDDAAARSLFAALLGAMPGPAAIDLSLAHPGAVTLAEAAGMRPVFETARMYHGKPPERALGRLYGLASFELG